MISLPTIKLLNQQALLEQARLGFDCQTALLRLQNQFG
jgi:hypothetical protein